MNALDTRGNWSDVLDALHVDDIVSRYGLKVRGRGGEYRLHECPRCKAVSRRTAVCINAESGLWVHHGHERKSGGNCSGNAIDLVAACEGIDSDDPRALEIAAQIAGVELRELTDAERRERRERRNRAREARDAEAALVEGERQRKARVRSAQYWNSLARRNRCGEAYLRSRALVPDALIDGDRVRFDAYGNPHVPMYGLTDSEIVNVSCRRIAPQDHESRIPVLSACPTAATICGRVRDIADGVDVVIVEGVMDTLSAIQLWPSAVALGAHCAGRLADVVSAVAPIVAAKRGRMLIVPDADDVGQRCALRAGEIAMDLGLLIDETLLVVDIGGHADLNDAHQNGWIP